MSDDATAVEPVANDAPAPSNVDSQPSAVERAPVTEPIEAKPPESVQETVKRAAAELSKTPADAKAAEAKQAKQVEKVLEALAAPKHLGKHDQVWKGLDRQFQQAILDRESQMGNFYQRVGTDAKSGRALEEAFGKYPDLFNPQIPRVQVVGEMLNMVSALRSGTPMERLEALGKLISDMGLTELVSQIGNGQVQPPQVRPPVPQEVQALQREIATLRAQFDGNQARDQEWIDHQADNALEAWQAESKPVHYEAVAEAMAHLLQGGQAQSFQEAYDKACALNPEVRSQVIQAEVDARIREAAQGAAKARSAAISPRHDGISAPYIVDRGRPETVQEAWQRAQRDILGG